MEKFDFYSEKNMQSSWKNKNKINNNHSELNHYCKEVDECHCKMVPKEKEDLKCEEAKKVICDCDKEPAIEKPNIDDHSSDGGHTNKPVSSPINSNRTSRNNSTDNLSYCSDNYFGDELLLLQNALSDDELYLNSDDCVYAYRGGGDFEIPLESREENADDETDFLEMDFDPDPSSEIEPQVQNAAINVQYLNADDDERQNYFGSPVGKVSDERVFSLSSNNSDKNSSTTPVRMSQSHITETSVDNQKQLTLTGARPKQTTDKSYCSSNRTRKDSKQRESDKFIGCNLHEITASIFGCYLKEQDETCLDCLESEFLAKTIGKPIDSSFCPRCKLNRNRLSYNNNSTRSISNVNDATQMNRATTNFDINDLILPPVDLPKLFLEHFGPASQMMKGIEKNTSKFSSRSANENILVQALDKLDIQYNADEIKEYFNKSNPDYFDIADFIVHESKKQCDYKSIIKLLHSASKEALRIRFDTDIRLTDSEDVEVRTHDILKIWSKNKNLDRVKKLKYKFKQMNVLGKIINVIRQAQQRLEKPLPDYILVPQYYKTGYISIERINF